ncbi:MAG: DegT/DnrJ/EryC1/StrS family aminotransferase [Flavobacteriaceae bacterium]|nr:DegT/DnrJ/EryC1/StrS family aminotransferase [Flavobacteriaceae bacterium]
MNPIQMVDLNSQYNFIKEEVAHGMHEVLSSSSFINGPVVHEFQKDLENYLDVKHVIPCANGTDALQIALMGLKLQPGDEVITADFTFAATVEVISLLKLKPVLVDVNPNTFNIDPLAIEKVINQKTKAIIPVHLFGQSADMEQILALAKKHNLYVVEDNAQAIGADYTFSNGTVSKTGTLGDVSATSFFPSKNLGAYGDGGAVFTNDDNLAHFIRGIVNHGMYERYHHNVVGVNSRLDSLQAAVLAAKLPHLDTYNAKRRRAAIKYNHYFQNSPYLITPLTVSSCEGICAQCTCHVFHQYTLRVKEGKRDGLAEHLKVMQIPFGIYYPIPLHRQKAYVDSSYKEEDFSVTNQLVDEVISLPMHSELEDDQIEFIAKTVLDYVN